MSRGLVYAFVFSTLFSFQFVLLVVTSNKYSFTSSDLSLGFEVDVLQHSLPLVVDILANDLVLGTENNVQESQRSPYAYAFVIGGCDPLKPAYRNYIYDILISASILQEHGSKADVVAFFQMSYHSNQTVLPETDLRLLQAMNVQIKYIPSSPDESFYRVMLDKFRILGLDYRRVLFLDGDVIPLANMDYLFELSDPASLLHAEAGTGKAVLKENIVVAGTQEPANGGFFMLTPSPKALQQINHIIQDREERGQNLTGNFDPIVGWGHEIDAATDKWVTNGAKAGTNWTFWAAFADQGLLYHYTKYARKSVSIVLADRVENWGADADGIVRLEETLHSPFHNYTQPNNILKHNCGRWTRGKGCPPPYSDYSHFSGRGKPWFRGPPEDLSNETKTADAEHLWWYTLNVLNDRLDMGIGEQLQNWTTGDHHRPLLGMHPSRWQAKNAHSNLEESVKETRRR